jgi:hypothetical protein
MADSRLEMSFKNQMDKKIKISIDNPRADLTETEVRTLMDNIIARNIFNSSGGDLVGVAGARIVTTQVQELTL